MNIARNHSNEEVAFDGSSEDSDNSSESFDESFSSENTEKKNNKAKFKKH